MLLLLGARASRPRASRPRASQHCQNVCRLGHFDAVAIRELPAPSVLDLTVDQYRLGRQQLLDVAALIHGVSSLEELPEPNHVAGDLDAGRLRHTNIFAVRPMLRFPAPGTGPPPSNTQLSVRPGPRLCAAPLGGTGPGFDTGLDGIAESIAVCQSSSESTSERITGACGVDH